MDAKGKLQTVSSAALPSSAVETLNDWLGHGICFWEANPNRALSYVKEVLKRKTEPTAMLASSAPP
jgi:hypothetical protein